MTPARLEHAAPRLESSTLQLRHWAPEEILVKNEQLTGRIQTCILIDGTARSVPVAEIVVDPLYFKGSTEALCMS